MKNAMLTTELNMYIVRVASQGIKYYLSQFNKFCSSSSAWSLQRHNVVGERSWNMARIDNIFLISSHYGFQSLWRDTYYRIVFPSYDVRFAPPAMWSINFGTKPLPMEQYLNRNIYTQ